MRWCPNCGVEYRAEIESCVDCGIDLVDERPPERDHVAGEIDVGRWTPKQREALELRLVTSDIAHSWDGDILVVPHVHLAEVERMIGALEDEDDELEPAVVLTREPSIGAVRFGTALAVAGALKVAGIIVFVVTAGAALWLLGEYPDALPGRYVQPLLTAVGGLVGGGTLLGLGYGIEIVVEMFDQVFHIRFRDDP